MSSSKENRYVIRRAEFRGQSLFGHHNKDVLTNLCVLLNKLDPTKFASLRYVFNGNQAWLSEHSDHPTWPLKTAWAKQIPGTNMWLYTNLKTIDIKKRAEMFVLNMGLPSTDLVIVVQRCDRFGRPLN